MSYIKTFEEFLNEESFNPPQTIYAPKGFSIGRRNISKGNYEFDKDWGKDTYLYKWDNGVISLSKSNLEDLIEGGLIKVIK